MFRLLADTEIIKTSFSWQETDRELLSVFEWMCCGFGLSVTVPEPVHSDVMVAVSHDFLAVYRQTLRGWAVLRTAVIFSPAGLSGSSPRYSFVSWAVFTCCRPRSLRLLVADTHIMCSSGLLSAASRPAESSVNSQLLFSVKSSTFISFVVSCCRHWSCTREIQNLPPELQILQSGSTLPAGNWEPPHTSGWRSPSSSGHSELRTLLSICEECVWLVDAARCLITLSFTDKHQFVPVTWSRRFAAVRSVSVRVMSQFTFRAETGSCLSFM